MHEMPSEASMMPALPASFALGRVPPPPSYTSRTAAGGKLKLRADALANAAVFLAITACFIALLSLLLL